MGRKRFVLLGLALGIGSATILWSGDAHTDREVLTMEQRSQALAELDEKRGPRIERIRKIKDDALSYELENVEFYLYNSMRSDLYFDQQTPALGYTQERFLRLHDYPSLQAMLDIYLNNFIALSVLPEGRRFAVRPGFEFPFDHTLRYTHVVLDDGEKKPLPDIAQGQIHTAEIRYTPDQYEFLQARAEGDALPVKVLAEFTTELPDDVIQFEFTSTDVGKTIEQGGYAVTLRRFTESSYDVDIEVPEEQALALRDWDIVGEAKAANERHVELRAEKKLRADYYAQQEAWLDDIIARALQEEVDLDAMKAEQAALHARLSEAEGGTLHKAYAFLGSIETARISILPRAQADNSSQHRIEIPVSKRPVGDFDLDAVPEMPLEGPVYHHWPHEQADLTAEDMQRMIRVSYDTTDPDHPQWKHAEQVYLHYPSVQSKLFISAFERYQTREGADTVRFYDAAGELIELPDRDDLFRFSSEGFAYNPHYLPTWPARMTARLPVLTAPNPVKQSYPADDLPEGISLQGNRLMVDYEHFSPEERLNRNDLATSQLNRFFAKDDSQRYLRQFDDIIEVKRPGGEPIQVLYFYGQPTSVEIWYQGETEVVEFDMDIELRDPPN